MENQSVYLSYNNEKQRIKDIINKEVAEHQSNLAQVKDYIEKEFHILLSSIDHSYIERKYIKCCSKFWVIEITDTIKFLTLKDRDIIREVFNYLDYIQSLSDVPDLFKQLKYYKLLIDHYKLVSKEDEKTLVSRFKTKFVEQVVAYSNTAKKELIFLENLVDFLSGCHNLQVIIAELKLKSFCDGELSFDEFLTKIKELKVGAYSKNLSALQEAAKWLQQKDLFLIDKFEEVIGAYIKPVEIQERKLDNRLVIEVKGKNVVINEILQQLESQLLEKPNIEEVRIIGDDIIHINADLNRKVWHGRNIVIFTKNTKIHDKVIWDVSGKDNNHIYSSNAGTGEDGHGKRGTDGYAGESGGNVLIVTEKIEDLVNITIISNGGRGSKGQDGGNGKDGDDGNGITKEEFDRKFPPVAKFKHVPRASNILKTVSNIKQDSHVIRDEWFQRTRSDFIFFKLDETLNDNVIEKIIKDCELTISLHGQVYRTQSQKCPFEGNIFINARTNQGNEITFSFERGGVTTNCQAFLLYKGALGQPGGQGGEYGLGGQGGYSGEIIVRKLDSQKFRIIKDTKQGEDGENGKEGLYGSCGKNGNDMGYLDYSVSGFFTETWPKFFGNDENSICTLKYYDGDNNPSSRVWCPYKDKYAGIIPAKIEHKKQTKHDERTSVRQNNDRQHHGQAVRKKNISQLSILDNYSHQFSAIEKNTLQNLRSDLETTKQQALQAITENQEQHAKQTIELRIKRHITHQKYEHGNDFTFDITFAEVAKQNIEVLFDNIKRDPQSLDKWFPLRCVELKRSELNVLFSEFITLKRFLGKEVQQSNTKKNKLTDIEKLLIDKYRLAMLQEIAKQLLNYQKVNFMLEEEGNKEGLYANIIAKVESFTQKQEFDDYLKNKSFLSNSGFSEEEQLNQYFNEEEDLTKIVEYFPDGEKQQLQKRLEKITFKYIGQQGIVHNIFRRFSNEGRHVSFQELCYLINLVLASSIDDRKEQNTFCWIVAAYPQRNWIDELILLQLENYFKKPLTEKSKLKEYLSKIENKGILLLFIAKLDRSTPGSSVSAQCIEDILYLLSNIPNETVSLLRLELSEWPYALKEKYWSYRLAQLTNWQESEKLPAASYYLLSVENAFGTDLVEEFLKILERNKQKLSPAILTNILSNFHNEKWNLIEGELKSIDSCINWAQEINMKFTADDQERDISQLVDLIKSNANTSKGICNNLHKIKDSICCISNAKYVIAGKPVGSFTENDIKNWLNEFQGNINKRKQIQKTDEEMLAVIDRAIELNRKFKLRDTQKLAVLALLTNNRNTLVQVSTGEGKSLIVVAVSIMKALCGEKVDIITSVSVLAKRDAEVNRDIYNLFGINVSHNCNEDIEKRKEAYSGNHVVYGDLSNFQRDYLLDKFYGKNILGDHNLENAIVDEVDSMLLDKGNNMLYLSHDLPGLDKLESVYIYIWQCINRPARNHEELFYALDTNAIKEAVINDLYGSIKKENIEKLGSDLSKYKQNVIWERLIEAEILDGYGKLITKNIDNNKLNKILLPEFIHYKERLDYLLKECIEREKSIRVPNCLRPFIEQHLESWINSAKTAYFMKAGQDYVVDVDRTGTSPDRNPNITILDRDTGTDQANSQWDEALHQFLQLKHGCKLSLQSLKAVFVSNVSFFKLYNNLYGLTGTLGSQRERDLLKEIHGVDFAIIPTAKSKQFHEYKPILCSGKEDWINHIHNEVIKLTEKNKRSVLIICETVNEVETLHKAFGGKDAKYVHTYTREYEEFDIAKGTKELEQGQIIIATNLSGRGTDIKITEKLKKTGGLHVCLTYLPNNIRIEQQAFGRAARNGDKGSGQLIIINRKGQEYSNSKILDLKKERDAEELHRISEIKVYYETQITVEENCFKAFKEQYEQLKKNLNDNKVPTEVKEILLQSCLDKWAFWLDENGKYIKNFTDDQSKRKFNDLLNNLISQLNNLESKNSENWLLVSNEYLIPIIESWSAWVKGNSVQMVKLGKYISKNKNHEIVIKLFDEVIKQESYFSEAAHYYKAFALAKKIDWEQKPLKAEDGEILKTFKKELREAVRLLDEHSTFSINAAAVIGKIKKNNKESIIQIDAYEEQQKSLVNLYYMFSQSIDDIVGHFVTPQSFINNDIKEGLAEILVEDLIREGMLNKPRVQKNISEEDLKSISSGYGISAKILNAFLSRYEGKEINENEFQKAIKKKVQLPSREVFWKFLIEQKVLLEEVKYIVVDNKKLSEVDPSQLDFLTKKVDKKELEKQTLDSNNNKQIFLNAEQIAQQKKIDNIFKKEDFVKTVGKNKYQILKKKGVLSFNRQACIDSSKIGSTTFSCYDSITLKDFTQVNITESEAKRIVAELVKQKIIEKQSGLENTAYQLKIKFYEIEQVQLPSCPVYENAVKGLLSVCFTYRIALQRIEKQLEDKNFPVRSQLMIKPHQSLVSELIEQKIIKSSTVTTKYNDLEKKLKTLYNRTMSKADFKLMISQERYTEELFDHLIEKGWITQEGIRGNIKNACIPLVVNLYSINGSDKRQKSLNSSYKDIENTIKMILDNRIQLAKEDTIKHITRTLERSKSSLKALKVPENKLKPLTEFNGQGVFANVEEVHVFILNGLDELLQLEEKKWTGEMLLNTTVVLAMGMSQIAIGTAIELYSVGVMSHVGSAFVNEGVSDIIYAAGCLKSGYFTWKDYKQHKLVSLMITATSVGIGAYLSRGIKVSRFGHKLAGPNFEYGKKIAEMSGTELIQTAGWKVVGKEVAKRITLKAIEGVAFGLANVGVDMLIENYLQTLCTEIASTLMSDIEREIEQHNVSTSLEEIYKVFGKKEAKKIINDLTNNFFTKQSYVEEFVPIANKIASSVTQGIMEATKKINKTGGKLDLPIHIISKVVVWLERSTHIIDVIIVTRRFLNSLNREINSTLENHVKQDSLALEQRQNANKVFQRDSLDYKSFKKEIIDQWKSQIRDKAGRIIQQHIVNPILKECANHLVRYAGKKIKEGYQSYKESGYLEKFVELKEKYQEELKDTSEQQNDNTSQTENHITEKYHEDLQKLLIKTKNPKLFAAIVRENIPMDMTCVNACTQVVHRILKMQGIEIPGLTIIVEGDGGIRQKFSSGQEGVEEVMIKLDLKGNHFLLCGSDTSENNRNGESKNNCLFEALSEAIPQLRDVTPENFRERVANCIENDPEIQHHIRQGMHKLPISLGAFAGATGRASSRRVNDESSSTCDNETQVHTHLINRFTRLFRFGGMIQRISEQTDIDRNEVVEGGASKFQDQSSNRGKEGIHAAHVVRAGKIHPTIKKEYQDIYKELRNYLGHTQNIPRHANDWHGIGGLIDKIQSDSIELLASIDFTGPLNEKHIETMNIIKDKFTAALDTQINKGKLSNEIKLEYEKARTTLNNINIEDMFHNQGRNGYTGKGMTGYREEY